MKAKTHVLHVLNEPKTFGNLNIIRFITQYLRLPTIFLRMTAPQQLQGSTSVTHKSNGNCILLLSLSPHITITQSTRTSYHCHQVQHAYISPFVMRPVYLLPSSILSLSPGLPLARQLAVIQVHIELYLEQDNFVMISSFKTLARIKRWM